MAIRVAIHHNTHYTFDRRVNLSPHVVRLRPAPHSRTPIVSYSLKIKPTTHFINWQQDAFGNYMARLVFPEKATQFSVEVEVIADMTVINPFDFFLEDYAQQFPFDYEDQTKKELTLYLEKTIEGPLFSALLKEIKDCILDKEIDTNDFLVAVNQLIEKKISYNIRMQPGIQTPEETLKIGSGSCRDSSWLLVQVLRNLGLATRFASGYLVQLKPDEKSLDGPSGAEQDFTDLHAWCEVYLPGAGWVGLDPTSGLFATEGHIPLACTPNPVSAAPITGYTDECEVSFEHSNEVTRIHEDPRVTKPYTEAQWLEINTLGEKLDRDLQANDVRLTMGGEPTFVSIDDMESAQWNTAALGEQKLQLAKDLLLRLREHFDPKGLLHYGQGKWYPGEELPRWALGLYWRKDGEALWENTKLLARVDKSYSADIGLASRFSQRLVALLGLDEKYIHPAYEDAAHYILEEQRLPKNLDLMAAKAGDDMDRRRIARMMLEQEGLAKPTGYVVPIAWSSDQTWRSSQWQFKRERLILSPGDSPLGLRLPLAELPQYEELEREITFEQDPFSSRQPLRKREAMHFPPQPVAPSLQTDATFNEQVLRERYQELPAAEREEKIKRAMQIREWSEVVRTAICIEPREGRLHLFMPPIYSLESYVQLIATIEEAAGQVSTPVVIEGYEPPRDDRLHKLLVTPDPGVIEVNVHPSNNWQELKSITETLYAAARESRLSAEKFMQDGRHTGTGGGNHVTLGGPTPADSPLLRRPDLLRSLVTYWQHHPALSYLFSGAFIGPTSQAPRIDEGRDELLYEMEIAFAQMPQGEVSQPWLIDRIMRNLLIDITGNTHRAEFCIDKLYSPDSPSGRQGILEFRGFEMPPHSRMSLVQCLLIRTLVARFWQQPYYKPLVRWGTSLHDKFMLPYFIWQDMKEVVRDINQAGFQFKDEWLLPFEEFRFPHYGRVKLDDIELELRWAIEPWHVLGEEVGAFGTSRYVDSSVERLQVRLTGLTDRRYVLACNGRRVPLHKTPREGEYVGGVRYRAWAPPSALHPTMGVHTPLVFDLIDTWNGRSLGGCTYHVSHPGGRSYDDFPVNAFAAESRRVNRFEQMGHSPGPYTPRPVSNALREITQQLQARPMAPPAEESPGEYPCTLDLRRPASALGQF
ncbi:MAG: transglutaminase family protein [Cellvibrionaceae bacterium]|nr:transglutaminase family protein [Cellvibrionaceae bacterium]